MSATEWLKAHWKPVAIVGAGAVGLYLLMQRQGGSAPADAAASLPPTGPPPQGDQTPPQYFSPAEQVAAELSQGQLMQQQLLANSAASLYGATPTGMDAGGHQEYSYGVGAVSKAWQQVVVGGQQVWEDIYHPGHIITEQQAQQLAPQDHGPYASGANALTLANFGSRLMSNIQQGLQIYAASQGVPVSLTPQSSGARPVGTPGIAPTPRMGVTPAPGQAGSIMESI